MSIASVVTAGFGNGTFDGSIALVTTRGYSIGEAVAAVTTKGGYVPPTYKKSKVRKRDESILEAVYELVAKSEESPIKPTVKVQKQITNVVEQAKIASTIQNPELQSKAIHQTMLQIDRLQITIIQHTIDAQKDEDAAIKALLDII